MKINRNNPFHVISIYRPLTLARSFLVDFLSSTIKLNKILLLGDINVHVDDKSCHTASEFLSPLDSFNFTQHITGPTHSGGHTLDLILSLGLDIGPVCREDIFISDHKYILFDLSFISDTLPSVHVKHSRLITDPLIRNVKIF